MTRWPLTLAVAALCALAASAPAAEGPGTAEPVDARALKTQLEDLTEGLRPPMEQLARLQAEYPLTPELAALEAERGRLREEITVLLARYQRTWNSFNVHRQREVMSRIHRVVADGDKGRLSEDIARTVELEEFYRGASPAPTRHFLAEEAAAWEAARLLIEKRRKLRGALLAAGGGLSVLAALGMAAFRRRLRLAALHAALPSPTGSAPAPLSAPAQSPLAGPASGPAAGPAVLGGNYRVERELGRGGMGVVLEALDLALQRKVALKRMRAEVSQEPKELERFLAEARLVAALKHPNIVEIHTMLREGSELYLVFELVPGRSLGERLAGGESLPPDAARALLRQIASALDYAHGESVIHRDLKPANIMVTPKGVAKVMDFGLAHRTKMTVARVSRMDSFGTMPYMAPEQELGEYSKESDVFALGVCAYEMLAGRLPFEGPNFLAQKRERHFAPLASAAPGLPPGWDAVIARALAPLPKDRFHSALELADALDAG